MRHSDQWAQVRCQKKKLGTAEVDNGIDTQNKLPGLLPEVGVLAKWAISCYANVV